MTRRARVFLDRLVIGLLLLGAWQAATAVAGEYWISSPWSTLKTLALQTASGEIPRHAAVTAGASLAGFALGVVPALALALWLRRHPLVRKVLDPFLVAGYGMPKLALAPLFILWLGIGVGSKIVLGASAVFFIIFFSAYAGVESVDARLVRMARVCGASDWQVSRRVVWPSVVPHVFAGIRIATPYAVGGVVISELISSNRGLGYLVQLGATDFSTRHIFAAVIAIAVVTGLGTWLAGLAEARALRWQAGIQP